MDEGLHTPHYRFSDSSEEWHGFPTLLDLRSIPENDLLGNASGSSFGINEDEACQDVSSFAGSSGTQWVQHITAAPAAPQHAQHQEPQQSQLIFDQANAALRQAKSTAAAAAAHGAGSDIFDRRAKNREASRRSRAKKKQREEELVRANEELQRENTVLKSENAASKVLLEQLKRDLASKETRLQGLQDFLSEVL